MPEKKMNTIAIPATLKNQIRKAAAKNGQTIQGWAELALRAKLKEEK